MSNLEATVPAASDRQPEVASPNQTQGENLQSEALDEMKRQFMGQNLSNPNLDKNKEHGENTEPQHLDIPPI